MSTVYKAKIALTNLKIFLKGRNYLNQKPVQEISPLKNWKIKSILRSIISSLFPVNNGAPRKF